MCASVHEDILTHTHIHWLLKHIRIKHLSHNLLCYPNTCNNLITTAYQYAKMLEIVAPFVMEATIAITRVVIARAASDDFSLASGSIQKLQKKFRAIAGFFNDLASANHAEKSQLVSNWLEKLKSVAYTADQIMDDYAYEMLRRKHELKAKERFHSFVTPSTNHVGFCLRITSRANRILSELDLLYKEASGIGLNQVDLAKSAIAASSSGGHTGQSEALFQARKHAAARGPDFIGRKLDMESLLKKVLNPKAQQAELSVLAIYGLGGFGKTTLARKLYENEVINNHFGENKIWVCVSEDFNVDKILKEMVESLTLEICNLTNNGAIVKKLDEKLKGQKFFLVLDDVWNESKEQWNSLKGCLQSIGDLTGSVTLITTRSQGVAKNAGSSYSHKIKGLSDEEGWALLKRQVFNESRQYDSSFEDVGKRIVKKCEGVPLAIKVIGGVLQFKQYVSDWEVIEESALWNIQSFQNNGDDILPSLLLSYNYINHVYVKQCFAYCAIFPKDSIMEKGQIIAMWLAQGLLHDDDKRMGETKETVGEKYINQLVNQSFFQEENKDHEIRYTMHDLVHDLASYVSKKDLLVWNVKDKFGDNVTDFQLRHLAFNFGKNELVPETLSKEKMRKLRTISYWNGMPRWESLNFARYMHTLVLAKVGLTNVPSVIEQFVHLRYLDLSENKIEALPDSICKLYQLQTLRLLRCFQLKELPKDLHKLKNLRHVMTSYALFASKGLQELTSLQTLPRLKLRNGEGWTIDELGPLDHVKGDVHIKGLEHASEEDAANVGLWKKDKILRLDLYWDSNDEGNKAEKVLDSLKPHANIQSLCIEGYNGTKFPQWMRSMSVEQSRRTTELRHLTEVILRGCKRCQQLPSLGQLPRLAMLKLSGFHKVECIGDEFYGNNVNISDKTILFPTLRWLSIQHFRSLTAWMPPTTGAATMFSCLEALEIGQCSRLQMIPNSHFGSLKYLSLDYLHVNQPLDIIEGTSALIKFRVSLLSEMEWLPQESHWRNLQILEIVCCDKLESLPNGMISLRELQIYSCSSLGSIEDGVLRGLSYLRKLHIEKCYGLKSIPKSLEDCTSMEDLKLDFCEITEDPIPDIGKLQGLVRLSLTSMGKLMAFVPQWIPQLHHVQYLYIGNRQEKWDMKITSNLTSLRNLELYFYADLKLLPEQPLQHLLPPSLRHLQICRFDEMEALPEWIGCLSSLQSLHLFNCKKLKYLPSKEAIQRLPGLSRLMIGDCLLLEERCVKDTGPEWHKISHITEIRINSNSVQDLRAK